MTEAGPDTDRDRAEAALRDSWASTTIALESTTDTVSLCRSVLDDEGRFADAEILFANEVARNRWFERLTLDEVRGLRMFERWPHLRPLIFDLYASVTESGRPFSGAREFMTPAGPRILDLSITPFDGGFADIGRDVTDERRAVAALRESEEHLRLTLEGVDAIVSFRGRANEPVIVSPQVRQILGYRPEDLCTLEAWDAIVHPDDLPACRVAWSSPSNRWKLEYRMRHADGAWTWVSDRGRRVTPADGGGPRLIGVLVDISVQRAAADALRESEARMRRMVEGIEAIVTYQEPGGDPAVLSPQVERILGYRPDEVSAFDAWNAIVHPDDLERCELAWGADDAVWDLEYRVRRADGTWAWVADKGRRIGPGDGVARGMFGVITDVTARHEAAERFRAVFEENPETIAICRPVLDEAGRFVDAVVTAANRVARDRGLGPDGAAPRLLSSWPDPDGRFREAAARVCDPGEPFRGEIRVGGEAAGRWSEVSLFPFAGGFALVGRDITEQKRSEQALLDSEARYRAVTDSAVDAIVTVDDAGTIVGWNPSAARLFGYATGEALGRPITLLMPPPAVGHHLDALARFAHGDVELGADTVAMTGRRADGSLFPLELSLAAWVVSDGRFATAIIRDITERRRGEEAARVADARVRGFLDSNIIGTLVALPEGRVVEANDYWLTLTGFTREDLEQGRVDWRAVTAPESLATDDHAIAEILDHGRSAPFEKEYLRADGTRVPVLVVRTGLPGEGHLVSSVVLDMTALRDASAGLARLAAAIEQASESVVVTDLDAAITYVNPEFERVTGYTRDEAIGRNPRILQSGVQAPAFYETMWATLQAGETWRGELVNRRRDGTLYTEVASISPIRDATGRVVSYVAVKRDVTAKRELEAQLRQSQRLEAIGQLAGGVAHDFNNILAAIRGYGELVQGALPPGTEARADIDEVLRAADRAAGLTRQLLAFSRRQVLAKQVLDPAAVIEDLAPMLRRLLGEHIELATTHAVKRGRVHADRGQLEQVIVNLAVNARDAMPDGGRLAISTASVGVSTGDTAPGAGPSVRITVSDTGTGMDAATLARVFEPFFTTKEPGKGTGMGLATVYGIVSQSEGTITVTSTPGRGSSFAIELPRIDALVPPGDAPASAASPVVATADDKPAVRVLLVEDDSAVRGLLARVLGTLGYRVHGAASGAEALRAMTAGPDCDVLVTDIRMPGMQGPELARRARAMRPGLPVLFISGLSDEAVTTIEPGGEPVPVLEKPFDASTLELALRRVLDGAT